jgi:hypothetical protein
VCVCVCVSLSVCLCCVCVCVCAYICVCAAWSSTGKLEAGAAQAEKGSLEHQLVSSIS